MESETVNSREGDRLSVEERLGRPDTETRDRAAGDAQEDGGAGGPCLGNERC